MRELCALVLLLCCLLALSCDSDAGPNYDGLDRTQKAFLAADYGDGAVIIECLRNGLDPNAVDGMGVPLLNRCLGPHASHDAVVALLSAGADPNRASSDGDTALMEAAMWVNLDDIRLLLSHGANPNAANDKGETALTRMGMAGPEDTVAAVKLLVDAGANVNARRKDGLSVLALRQHSDDSTSSAVAKFLQEHGAH